VVAVEISSTPLLLTAELPLGDERGDEVVDRARSDQVVVVEDQDQGLGQGVELVHQGAGQDPRRRQVGRAEERPGVGARVREGPLKRGHDVGEKDAGIPVLLAQGNPGGPAGDAGQPAAQEGALPVAGGGADEGEGVLPALLQTLQEERTGNGVLGHRRPVELSANKCRVVLR